MWISKKMWSEMCDRVDELERDSYINQDQIVWLNALHEQGDNPTVCIGKEYFRAKGHLNTEQNSNVYKFARDSINNLVQSINPVVAQLKEDVNALEKAHSYKSEENIIFDDGITIVKGGKRVKVFSHDGVKADTDQVKDVTLQELARLVMDDEPIVRKTMEEKTNYYGRKVD